MEPQINPTANQTPVNTITKKKHVFKRVLFAIPLTAIALSLISAQFNISTTNGKIGILALVLFLPFFVAFYIYRTLKIKKGTYGENMASEVASENKRILQKFILATILGYLFSYIVLPTLPLVFLLAMCGFGGGC